MIEEDQQSVEEQSLNFEVKGGPPLDVYELLIWLTLRHIVSGLNFKPKALHRGLVLALILRLCHFFVPRSIEHELDEDKKCQQSHDDDGEN